LIPRSSHETTQHTRQIRLIALIHVKIPPSNESRTPTLGSLARKSHVIAAIARAEILGAGLAGAFT
jgi:hypothetical protein